MNSMMIENLISGIVAGFNGCQSPAAHHGRPFRFLPMNAQKWALKQGNALIGIALNQGMLRDIAAILAQNAMKDIGSL